MVPASLKLFLVLGHSPGVIYTVTPLPSLGYGPLITTLFLVLGHGPGVIYTSS
jgi:hypothetical protein